MRPFAWIKKMFGKATGENITLPPRSPADEEEAEAQQRFHEWGSDSRITRRKFSGKESSKPKS